MDIKEIVKDPYLVDLEDVKQGDSFMFADDRKRLYIRMEPTVNDRELIKTGKLLIRVVDITTGRSLERMGDQLTELVRPVHAVVNYTPRDIGEEPV